MKYADFIFLFISTKQWKVILDQNPEIHKGVFLLLYLKVKVKLHK